MTKGKPASYFLRYNGDMAKVHNDVNYYVYQCIQINITGFVRANSFDEVGRTIRDTLDHEEAMP